MTDITYVVFGATGEYDDHTEWPVVAYCSRRVAYEHAQKANQWCEDHGVSWHDSRRRVYPGRELAGKNPWDPCFIHDYTGTSYRVVEVPSWGDATAARCPDARSVVGPKL